MSGANREGLRGISVLAVRIIQDKLLCLNISQE